MLAIYYCIQDHHDLRMVVLAGLLCVTASIATIMLLRHARRSIARERRVWLAAAGATSGFGIWATHFIAMIGYDPGVVVGYDLFLTLASLAVAVVSTTLGLSVALGGAGFLRRTCAAVAIGSGLPLTPSGLT